ncbi:MAG: acyl-ACP--UDP-N-acetylglucosamine O-acyltransferase [Bdellovibrionales bacterium]|nr:acyl-ACP--UDP-N-acetylglucosamine O-acyltransferase [Bdellovibrionales bacterium]
MIHATAQVDSRAELDRDVTVGPWCIVGPGVRIKRGTVLRSHVVIEGNTEIGEGNVVHPFTVLGGMPQDLKYKGENTRLVIGDRNVIRESVTMNLGTAQAGGITQVGNDNLIMAYVHLGHDCIVGNQCVLSNNVGLAGHVIVEDSAILCGQTGVSQFCRVGAHTYIGGQSGIEKSVPPFTIALGSRPCSIKGANIVGLRRRGFPVETIQKINEAIKLWMREDVKKEQCLLEIESQYGELSEVKQFLEFIRKSEGGVVR